MKRMNLVTALITFLMTCIFPISAYAGQSMWSQALNKCKVDVFAPCNLDCLKKYKPDQAPGEAKKKKVLKKREQCFRLCDGLLDTCAADKVDELVYYMNADTKKKRTKFMKGCRSKVKKCNRQCRKKYGRDANKLTACLEKKCAKRFDMCAIQAEEKFPDKDVNEEDLTKQAKARCRKTFEFALRKCRQYDIYRQRCYDDAEKERDSCLNDVGVKIRDKMEKKKLAAEAKKLRKCDDAREVCVYKNCLKKGKTEGDALRDCLEKKCERRYQKCRRSAGL